MTLEMCLKSWAWLEFQYKEGILSSVPYPPVSSCHHMSSFGYPLPSPSSDDVIYEEPQTQIVRKTHLDVGDHTFHVDRAPEPDGKPRVS